jgi:hypothetical protein
MPNPGSRLPHHGAEVCAALLIGCCPFNEPAPAVSAQVIYGSAGSDGAAVDGRRREEP